MKNILLLVVILVAIDGFAQDHADYRISSIPDSLKTSASSVCRLDELNVNISSPAQYTETAHEVITLLNDDASGYLHQRYGFDKFRKFKMLDVKILDGEGKTLKEYKKKDFEVRSAYDGISLATDDKILDLNLPHPEYPFTLDISWECEVNSYISLPSSSITSNTENFYFTARVPTSLDLRYHLCNLSLQPNIKDDGKWKTYTWEAKNIKRRKFSSDGYRSTYYTAGIELAPNFFEYDGYKGTFKTWADYGKWSYDLFEEKKTLSDQRKEEMKTLTATCKTDKEKISVIYDYLKRNMRYVSIQFGIGGFKPFPVKFVDENKYGDCKALTNYMRSLLDAVGIRSYPALINAEYDNPPVDPSFPVHKFNHVILCVPGKDTTWLECTSNNNAAGFLGSFTENRNALLLTENGGILVRTPSSSSKNNCIDLKTEIFVTDDGTANADCSIYATGDIYDLFHLIGQMNQDRQKEIFVGYLGYKPSETFALTENKDTILGGKYRLALSYDKAFDFKAGNKYFFSQRIYSLGSEHLGEDEHRDIEYLFHYPYEKNDTTVYHLPHGFSPDNLPGPVEWNNDWTYYKRTIQIDNTSNTVTVTARLVLKSNVIPPTGYSKVVSFFNDIKKDEDQKIILKKS